MTEPRRPQVAGAQGTGGGGRRGARDAGLVARARGRRLGDAEAAFAQALAIRTDPRLTAFQRKYHAPHPAPPVASAVVPAVAAADAPPASPRAKLTEAQALDASLNPPTAP